jgi:DNA polymerase I
MSDVSGVFSTDPWGKFDTIWHVDFEYRQDQNHHPVPVCMYAFEQRTGTAIQLRRDQLLACRRAPFDTGRRSVMIAYAANAESSCFLPQNWPFPCNVLDVYVECIAAINGLEIEDLGAKRPNMLEALTLFGLPSRPKAEKERVRNLILSCSEYTEEGWGQILPYKP